MCSTITRLIFSGILFLLPITSLAEGALRILECSLDQRCDTEISCSPESGDVVFTMEPEMLDDEGAGSYVISYAGKKSAMTAMSFAGPFTWNSEGEIHTLLANSENRFLWHKLSLSPTPEASMQFLDCAFTQ